MVKRVKITYSEWPVWRESYRVYSNYIDGLGFVEEYDTSISDVAVKYSENIHVPGYIIYELEAIVPDDEVDKIKSLFKEFVHEQKYDNLEFFNKIYDIIIKYDELAGYKIQNTGGDYQLFSFVINEHVFS